ncbi:MAG: serine--tRNA ligase, partial [Actinomycetota bacterium]
MLDIKRLRSEPDELRRSIERRGIEAPLGEFLELDRKRRDLLVQTEDKKAERNRVSDEIAAAKRSGEEVAGKIEAMQRVGEEIKALDDELRDLEAQINEIVLELPNPPLDDVPDGTDESANVTIRTFGEPRDFGFEPRAHWDTGRELGIVDQERGAKIAESRFTLLKGQGALLERA